MMANKSTIWSHKPEAINQKYVGTSGLSGLWLQIFLQVQIYDLQENLHLHNQRAWCPKTEIYDFCFRQSNASAL